jgi:hypothetical protein
VNITAAFHGDHPVTFEAESLSGFHRPLNGEVANLTLTFRSEALWPEWLEAPPLGTTCTVSYDGETVLDGALYGVQASAQAVELRIEG